MPLSEKLLTAIAFVALAGGATAQVEGDGGLARRDQLPAPVGPVPPAPGGAVVASRLVDALTAEGESLLAADDPVGALDAFRRVHSLVERRAPRVLVGTGACHLLLGRPRIALAYADAALLEVPLHAAAVSLRVRSLLRAREFTNALREARAAVEMLEVEGRVSAEPLAALASALFRNRLNDEAAQVYIRVLELDPSHAEAHLRLGSGLTKPRAAKETTALRIAAEAQRTGDLDEAERQLRLVLEEDPGHPVAHRLLGEVLFARRAGSVGRSPEFATLRRVLVAPPVDDELLARFLPDYPDLLPARQAAVRYAVAPFRSRLGKLLTLRARHDLLGRLERTTDAPARATLRGRRTFDGRVWDDVRGIGGLRAATGIEALDEAILHGFDTLAHEIAHQAHFYGLGRRVRNKISRMFERARDEGRFLDYYAASNDAEYFAQGVEAFTCYGKRPTREATHGHTRFELMRRDPELHELIDSLVDFDPLDDPAVAIRLLQASVDVALRCGRAHDAFTAARLLPPGADRERRLGAARRARREAVSL